MMFLGADVSKSSLLFAFFTALAQFLQMHITLPKPPKKVEGKDSKDPAFGDELAKSMNMQMKYFLPVMVIFIAYSISSVIAL